MSCYNWEAGTIQLPKSQFAKIKKQFIADYNAIMQRELDNGKRLREHVLEANKGKRGVDWWMRLQDAADRFNVSFETVSKMCAGNGNKKPRALNKKIMEFANSKTMSFSLDGEGSVTFNPENKTVTYDVWENNRAVERARESKVGQLFFRTMKNVNWTRGSGGKLYGNDEYNIHESRGYEGGGNYVTETFPPPKVDKRRRLW